MMDGVPSWVNVLLADSVLSCVTAPELQEEEAGFYLRCSLSYLVLQEYILVMAPELQEDWGGTITGNVY